jgi:fumarate reductase subunit D
MQNMIFIADLIVCSTCFGHHYAHHQELETIIQKVAACGIWCFGFQVVGMVWSWGLCVLQQPANRTHNPKLDTIPTT